MSPRRKRGTLKDPTGIHWDVERASKEKFDALAKLGGVSSAVFFERVVDHIEVNELGLPTWWSEYDEKEVLFTDTD